MLLTDLITGMRITVSTLDDPTDVTDEQVVNILRQGMRILSAWTGFKFIVAGATWDAWDVTSPVMDDSLSAIIMLQAKYLLHSNSIVIKTKVGPILVDYDPKALDREQSFLYDLVQAYATTNGLLIPTGFSVVSMNEYDMILNPNIAINTINGAQFGFIFNDFWI